MIINYKDSLGSHELSLDLREKFPRPWRAGIHRQFYLILFCVLAMTLSMAQYGDVLADTNADGLFLDVLSIITFNLFFGCLLIISLALIYEEFHHRSYYYGIDSGNLIIVHGVFVKARSSYPLNKITDVYVTRNWIDLLFGLYNVNFSTANNKSFEYGQVVELNRDGAVHLQELLTNIVGDEELQEESTNEDDTLVDKAAVQNSTLL